MRHALAVVFVALTLNISAQADTPVSGTVVTSTWLASGSPYRVTGDITVPVGETLTIETGVEVLFNIDVPFLVEGSLQAIGTETDNIRFLKGTVAEWGGIRITGGDSSTIHYVRVSDGHCSCAVR